MKQLTLSILLALFLTAFGTNANAQTVTNNTGCSFGIKLVIGSTSCLLTRTVNIIVPAGTSVGVALMPGEAFVRAQGNPNPTTINCRFRIGIPCSGLPGATGVLCAGPCGNYTASITPTQLSIQ